MTGEERPRALPEPVRIERAVRWYRRLLTLLPGGYRETASDELLQVFRDAWVDEWRSAGRRGTGGLWLRVTLDLVRTAAGEWAREVREWRRARKSGRRTRPSGGDRSTGEGGGDGMLVQMASDVRHAVRGLVKTPSFTAVAVLILGLGIGANTTIFAVLDAVYFDAPPHVVEPDRLVRLYRTTSRVETGALAYPDYAHYRDHAEAFDGLMAYAPSGVALTIVRADGRVDGRGRFVSDNYFDVLGSRPAVGRWFLPEEDRTAGTHRVAVISHRVWGELFGSDPGAVGQTVQLNGHTFTVVGVAPEGFRGPSPLESPPDVWFPFQVQPVLAPTPRPYPLERVEGNVWVWIWAMGRLRDGVTIQAAQDNVTAMAAYLEATYPSWNKGWGARLYPDVRFHPPSGASLGTMARLLLAVVVAVLLIASANIAILLLARGSARARDVAVRVAVGAGRHRIVRAALTESLVLGLLGGAVGVGVAYLTADLVAGVLPTTFSVSFTPDATVLAFAVGVAIATALVFGLIPSLQASAIDVNQTLKGDDPRSGRSRLRSGLVVTQVAVSVSLAVAAALLARSLATASAVPLGYEVEDRTLLSLNLANHGYDEEEGSAFIRRALERLRAVPGVRSVSSLVMTPFRGRWSTEVPGPGEPRRHNEIELGLNAVSPGFFETMGIRILSGRGIESEDTEGATPVLVVSESTARRLWPGEDPLGQRIYDQEDGSLRWEVVGVAEDTRFNDLSAAPDAYGYLAHAQRYQSSITFVVEGQVPVGPLREAILSLDPGMAITGMQTMKDAVNQELARFRTSALLVGVFGALALVLAMVGLYGVLSYAVVRATREIGIRVALGASTRRVARSVVINALRLTGTGLVLGGVMTLAGTRLLASFLYGVGPRDPVTWVGAGAAVLGIAALASLLPAVRAAQVDPMVALRAD